MRVNPHLILFASAALVALFIVAGRMPDVVLWNDTASMPTGFYVRTDDEVERGSIVTLFAQQVSPDYARIRGAGPRYRFLKRVAATEGDEVCALGSEITINGVVGARRSERDRMGRALPTWSGCVTLTQDQFAVLGETEDSFDSRYFGVVEVSDIEGVWRPLITRSDQKSR